MKRDAARLADDPGPSPGRSHGRAGDVTVSGPIRLLAEDAALVEHVRELRLQAREIRVRIDAISDGLEHILTNPEYRRKDTDTE